MEEGDEGRRKNKERIKEEGGNEKEESGNALCSELLKGGKLRVVIHRNI